MTGSKAKSILLSFFLLIFLIILGASQSAKAETLATALLTASEGVYVHKAFPTVNWDEGLLGIQGDSLGGAQLVTLLKFDLSGVGFVINTARLNLSVINDLSGCSITSDAAPEIRLYGANSSGWDETTVVYNDIGVTVTQGALLDDLDENPLAPGPPFGPPGHAHFTDDVGGGTFASFLEAERTTGDFTAGLWLEVTSGIDQVWFDDDEGTGATFGCAGADLLPTLQLAEAGSPTAVNLQTLAVNYQGGSPVVIAGGTLLLALVSFWLLRRGQRSSQTS